MRFTEYFFKNTEVQKLSRECAAVLSNISRDNTKYIEIKGTTAATPDSSQQFRHAMGQIPTIWHFLEGRVYVPKDGASENNIDIRSANASESFRLLIVA